MTTPLRGYALTILAWHLHLFPETVEGTVEDGFRITNPLTGISLEWCPHLDVHQARTLFWDMLPSQEIDVRGDSCIRHNPDRRVGYYQTHDQSLGETATVAWSATNPEAFTEAEALLWATCQAIQARQH